MASEDELRLSSLELNEQTPAARPKPRGPFVDQEALDESRKTELASVQQMNNVLEGVISSLDKAKTNMEVRIPSPLPTTPTTPLTPTPTDRLHHRQQRQQTP